MWPTSQSTSECSYVVCLKAARLSAGIVPRLFRKHRRGVKQETMKAEGQVLKRERVAVTWERMEMREDELERLVVDLPAQLPVQKPK